MATDAVCEKCGSPMGAMEETATGKKLQRCSKGTWNPESKQVEGCDYVKWFTPEPETLDEQCPKCGAKLVMQITRGGSKLKKCSTNQWDREAKKAVGCDYVEWQNGSSEELNETCPDCGEKLVLRTTANGKRMKKCSTGGWDREKRQATGCAYVEWLNDAKPAKGSAPVAASNSEPPHPADVH